MEDLQNVDGMDPMNGRRSLGCTIKNNKKSISRRAARKKNQRRRGVGEAQLEKLRLLEHANEREELRYCRSGNTVVSHSQLFEPSLVNVSTPSNRIQTNMNWVIGSVEPEELPSYPTMPHYLDTCPNCLKKRRRPIYSTKDFNMENVARERKFLDDAALEEGKSGRMELESFEWSGGFLDLSLSTINYRKEKEKFVPKVAMAFYSQDDSAAPERTLEAVFGERRKIFSPTYCGEDRSFASSRVSPPAPPWLELTLGLPI